MSLSSPSHTRHTRPSTSRPAHCVGVDSSLPARVTCSLSTSSSFAAENSLCLSLSAPGSLHSHPHTSARQSSEGCGLADSEAAGRFYEQFRVFVLPFLAVILWWSISLCERTESQMTIGSLGSWTNTSSVPSTTLIAGQKVGGRMKETKEKCC